ncbi:phosphate/phosphite/phosphonate ABC transporter substrate-binding protein [Pikeienuella piscinae]|uniref:phosphate/phosphite/phosphonate ABC transporter substrate-binding protein n=1 Tax=Pikeienuella piscinae TaxID=2748098 RepID=UPI001BA60D3E|nr:PhnD/SsuA/transferrin family substrate-binding protein [Pikeienuella piscinae]
MPELIANARMYAATPAVAALWTRLFSHVSARAGAPLEVVAHPAPAPLDTLWSRPDMGLVFMCGWPFQRAEPRPVPVAAPVPVGEEEAIYRSDIIARADGPIHGLEDAFGGVMAWTAEGSHSGWNAPRRLLADHARGGALFARTVGPVITPRGAIAAVLNGEADIAPLDGYFHLLLKRHEPETAARLRVVAQTPAAPIPLLVASPRAPRAMIEPLRAALLSTHEDDEGEEILAALALRRFAPAIPDSYALTERWREEAEAAGYPRIA